ncbi:hypothetical protein PK28_08685 [Hymenobacter sp. DG25B]|uniref:hypothetical protein n=1 Tax=Hymenobacter sp. DG25B TaxID=1385664 RepID=UPI000540FBDC|nr:hypothetical protein [Hymenobacter sp. DG25B]AIZ63750.1 hypothetical protein PK28_08685 [Hymenobacter sp. DG25B]
MASPEFTPFPPDLPPAELQARLKRQSHVTWGVAIATIAGAAPSPQVLEALQKYIDGDQGLEDLMALYNPADADTQALAATVRREKFTR